MSNSKSMMLAAIGLFVVLALGAGLIVWPNYHEAHETRAQITALEARIAGLSTQTLVVEQLTEQVAAAQARVSKQFKIIPDSPDAAGLIRKFSQNVDRVRVVDQTFNTGSPADAIIGSKSSVQAMPLTVDMEATFDSVFALIQNAESIDRLVRVATVRVQCKHEDQTDGGAGDRPPIVKASVGLEAIYEPDLASAAKEGQ